MAHCLWDNPEGRTKVYAWYASRVGASAAMDPAQLTRIVVSWEGRLKNDQDSRSQMTDDERRLLFKGSDGMPTLNAKGVAQRMRGKDRLFLAPDPSWTSNYQRSPLGDRTNRGAYFTVGELDELYVEQQRQFSQWGNKPAYLTNESNWAPLEVDLMPLMEPTRHKGMYVDACLREIEEIRAEVIDYRVRLKAHIRSMETDIRTHLWVTPDFVEPAARSLERAQQDVETLLTRVDNVITGFQLLPRERDDLRQVAT